MGISWFCHLFFMAGDRRHDQWDMKHSKVAAMAHMDLGKAKDRFFWATWAPRVV
jgi:hypothetical protein